MVSARAFSGPALEKSAVQKRKGMHHAIAAPLVRHGYTKLARAGNSEIIDGIDLDR